MTNSRIVFAGGGHAHVYSLRRTAELAAAGHDVTLVSDSPYLYYSGMATGVISGRYSPDEPRIDVRALVEAGGGSFIEGKVEHVLPKERVLLLEDGRVVPYDVASFCLGSETKGTAPDHAPSIPVKPVENVLKLKEAISGASSVLVIGGGAAGCEVAANAASITGRRITLVEAGPDLLSFAPKKARRIVREHLRGAGVDVITNRKPSGFEDGSAILGDGRRVPADIVVAATGVAPPEVFARSGLATGDDGGLWVNHYLQSASDGRIFGGGDSVAFRGGALPRFGVYAIRQGPVLLRNLQAALEGKPLEEFRPQSRFLYILNLGDGTGLAVCGPLVWRGRAMMRLKSFIDERFVGGNRR